MFILDILLFHRCNRCVQSRSQALLWRNWFFHLHNDLAPDSDNAFVGLVNLCRYTKIKRFWSNDEKSIIRDHAVCLQLLHCK